MGESDQGRTNRRTVRRLTVPEAADQLGVSVDAVRARVRRGTIAHERVGGRVYIILDPDQDSGQDPVQGSDQGPDHRDALISELRDRVRALEQANSENRRIIAGLVERMPELEAPPSERFSERSEARESPERAGDRSDRGTTVPDEPERAVSRPFWRRWFG